MRRIEDDKMQAVSVGICHECFHRLDIFNCTAFPQGIPKEILMGDVDHHEPYPGDHGIQFKQKADVQPAAGNSQMPRR